MQNALSRTFLHRIKALLAVSLLCLAGTGLAQDLASSTPAGSLIVFGFRQEAEPAPALRADLETLDWQAGLDTIAQLAEATGAAHDLGFLMQLMSGEGGADGALDFCPALQDLLMPGADHPYQTNLLASVGFTPFNPMPAFTLVAELGPEHDQLYNDATSALMACASESAATEFISQEQDGVQFWQMSDSLGVNLSFGRSNGVFALSSSVDQLRYVLRLLAGSDEPSLATSRLYSDWAALERGPNGFDWYVDYSVVGDLVEAFGPNLGSTELANQLAASFRSAGGVVGSLNLTDNELVYQNLLLPDQAGGDAALIDLLLSRGISLPSAPIVPAGAVSVGSQVMDVQGAISYLQGWLDRLSPMIGQELDLQSLLGQVGIDLDAALLDWIGTDIHLVQLETSTDNLASLVRGPSQLILVNTRDPAAAQEGVLQLIDLIRLVNEMDPDDGFDLGIDIRPSQYLGVDYTRVRIGPITDLAYTTLGDYLVVGMPSASLEAAIAESSIGSAAVSSRPNVSVPGGADLTQLYWLDAGAELASLVNLLSDLVQPVAWGTRLAALEEASAPEWDDWGGSVGQDWSDNYVYDNMDLSGISAAPLLPGAALPGELVVPDDGSEAAVYYQLQGIEAGDSFSVRLDSNEFDTMLELYELETGNKVAYNDDYDWSQGTSAQIDFTALSGVTYVVRGNSWYWDASGTFSITLSVDGAEGVDVVVEEEVQVPTFSQFLDLFDLIPQAVGVLADRTGQLEGFQERRGESLYTRYVLQVDW